MLLGFRIGQFSLRNIYERKLMLYSWQATEWLHYLPLSRIHPHLYDLVGPVRLALPPGVACISTTAFSYLTSYDVRTSAS